MRGTDQMEEKKHAEHVRHEFSIMFKHYRMFHHVVPNLVPNDYQELEAKEIIRTIFNEMTSSEKSRALQEAEDRIFHQYFVAYYNYLYDYLWGLIAVPTNRNI